MATATLGPHERDAVHRRIAELEEQLASLLQQRLPRERLADKWRATLDELVDLKDKLASAG
jgi:hypothetical protein